MAKCLYSIIIYQYQYFHQEWYQLQNLRKKDGNEDFFKLPYCFMQMLQ